MIASTLASGTGDDPCGSIPLSRAPAYAGSADGSDNRTAGDGPTGGFEIGNRRKAPPIFVDDEEFYAVLEEFESVNIPFIATKLGRSIRFRFSAPNLYRHALQALDKISFSFLPHEPAFDLETEPTLGPTLISGRKRGRGKRCCL